MSERKPLRAMNLVYEQPFRAGSRARLFMYGVEAVAVLRGVSIYTVRRDVKRGRVVLGELRSVVDYIRTTSDLQSVGDVRKWERSPTRLPRLEPGKKERQQK